VSRGTRERLLTKRYWKSPPQYSPTLSLYLFGGLLALWRHCRKPCIPWTVAVGARREGDRIGCAPAGFERFSDKRASVVIEAMLPGKRSAPSSAPRSTGSWLKWLCLQRPGAYFRGYRHSQNCLWLPSALGNFAVSPDRAALTPALDAAKGDGGRLPCGKIFPDNHLATAGGDLFENHCVPHINKDIMPQRWVSCLPAGGAVKGKNALVRHARPRLMLK